MIDIKVYGGSAEEWKGGALVLPLREEDCAEGTSLPLGDLVREPI